MQNYLKHPAAPYVLPLFTYIGVQLIGSKIHPDATFITFPIAVTLCTLLVFYHLNRYPKLLEWKKPLTTIAIGILAAALWILPYDYFIGANPDPHAGFNPGAIFESRQIVLCSLIIRVFGSVVTIALIEELFWRGFLQRYLINENFESVSPGKYTPFSFFGTALMIVLIHADQWPVAIPWALISTSWYVFTRSLGSMVLLHAVTNLILAIYVILTGKWYFW